MPDTAIIWSVVIGIISFIWIVYTRLSSSTSSSNDEFPVGENDLKSFTKTVKLPEILELPVTNAVWTVGITEKAASVTEDVKLRLMEFRSQQKIDYEYIEALLIKAMVEPTVLIEEAGEEKTEFLVRPAVVIINESKFMSSKVFDQVVEKMKEYGVKVVTKSMLGSELDDLLSQRKAEILKQEQESQKKLAEMSKDVNVEWASQPPRGCFQCHQEIQGKASQCSACKAVIYCSGDCAKKDWAMHKQICPLFKADMDRIVSGSLHSFPFTYYPENKPFCNYNTVNMLIKNGVHNVGVFRRLCICYQNVPMGELFSESLKTLEDANMKGPKDIFNSTGLSDVWYPLSGALKNSRKIKNWKDLFEAKKAPLDDIAPFVLDHPMTIWHFLNNNILDNVQPDKDGRKAITLHYLGAEAECDFLPVFEILLALIPPKTDLAIHMIGPSVFPSIPKKHRYFTYKSTETDANLVITLSSSVYNESYYSGEQLAKDFPKLPFGKGLPTGIMILNGLLLGYETWLPSIQLIVQKRAKVFCSEGMEQNASAVGRNLLNLGHRLTIPVDSNPFRQPVFQFKKDANLPAWSNGFIFGF